MIYVCDAIMGAGKSTAAINYMNSHKDRRFIYVTPNNDETKRIRHACPDLHFVLPSNMSDEYEHQKRVHFKHLLSCGENIATTHVLFSLCDEEAISMIEEQGYTLMIDESVAALDKIPAKADDVRMAMGSEWFQCNDIDDGNVHEITTSGKEYTGSWMRDIKLYAQSHRLVALKDADGEDKLYCWMFNSKLFTMNIDTFVLTYIFTASPMSYLFQMHNISYQYIGVVKDQDGNFQFSWTDMYIPEYTKRLKEMIHIVKRERMNRVGAKCNGKSNQWSINNTNEHLKHRSDGKIDALKKNLDNYFNNIHRGSSPEEKLWTCYPKALSALKGRGYASRYLVFNQRATNDYKSARILAYCFNVYMPLWEKRYYEKLGITVDENAYSLSVLIQWIWRSAIRDGEEIWIYIPVQRMRELLEQWIDEVSSGVVGGAVGTTVSPNHYAAQDEEASAAKEITYEKQAINM